MDRIDMGDILNLVHSEELKALIREQLAAEEIEGKRWFESVDRNVRASYAKRGFVTDEEFFPELERFMKERIGKFRERQWKSNKKEFGLEIIGKLTPTQEKIVLSLMVSIRKRLILYSKAETLLRGKHITEEYKEQINDLKQELRRKFEKLERILREYGSITYLQSDFDRKKEEVHNRLFELNTNIQSINKSGERISLEINRQKDSLFDDVRSVNSAVYELEDLERNLKDRWDLEIRARFGLNPSNRLIMAKAE